MTIDDAPRDEQVRYLSKQLAIPLHEADRLLENMVSDS